jgi:hypothetical protein
LNFFSFFFAGSLTGGIVAAASSNGAHQVQSIAFAPTSPAVSRTVNRPVDLDFPQSVDTVSGPTQVVQGDHATRKAVPRQLDFTSMYGGPAGSAEGPVRTQPPVYGILNPTPTCGNAFWNLKALLSCLDIG